MQIEIQLASPQEKPLIKRMMEFYLYDLSEFLGFDLSESGEYRYRYLDHYWDEEERHPFVVRVDGKLAGFVLVNQAGYVEGVEQTVAEFCILRKYRKKGIGKYVAYNVFDQFSGMWEVRILRENREAEVFWRKVIREYSRDTVTEYKEGVGDWDGLVLTFKSKGNELH